MTAGRGRARHLGVGLLTALLVGALVAPASLAQELEVTTDPDLRLVVTALDGVVGPAVDPPADDEEAGVADLGLRVLVENEGEVDVGDLQVVAQVYPPVGGARSLLHEALDDQTVDREHLAIARVNVREGDELLAGDVAGEQLTIPGDDIGWQATNDVYPVKISVLYGTEVPDEVVTAVVHLNDLQGPLQTTLVWPLSAPTERTAAGRYAEAVPQVLAPGGRLDVLLSTLERRPETPVILAPGAEMVEELADRANGFRLVDGTEIATDDPAAVHAGRLLDRLRAVVEAAPYGPVNSPYGRADVAALASVPGAIADLAPRALETAATRLEALLGRAPDDDLYLSTTPLTPAAMDLLATGTHLLLPADQVTTSSDLADELDLGRGRTRVAHNAAEAAGSCQDPPERCPVATVADPDVARVLADPPVEAGLVVARQRMIAETAQLYLTRPADEGRALLLLPPVHWDPSRGVPETMLASVLDSPWLELSTPRDGVPSSTDDATLGTAAASLPTTVATELIGARDQLAALRAAMPDELPDLAGQTVSDLEDALLRALTPETLDAGGTDALARIRDVRDVAETAFGQVALIEDTGVTLTSDTGQVPITLQRTAGGDIDLVVEVSSGAGLIWDEGGRQQQLTLPEGASRTVSFDTRAVARGRFAVTVSVWDPTHSKLLDRATLPVTSTAISRTAIVIIGSIVVALLAVGARRRRSPSLEVVR